MNTNVQVDTLHVNASGGKAAGTLAAKLLASGMNVDVLRTNDVLRKDDWIKLDNKVIEVARTRLVGVADLFSRGLSYPVSQALGVTRLEWERISDFGSAEVNMSGVAEGRNDRVEFDLDFLPLPIVHKDFNINVRALEASRRNGHPLDTTQAELAARIVAEKVESMLFLGGPNYGTTQGAIYGYTTAPNKKGTALGHNWSTNATGENMLADVLTMIDAMQASPNNMFGPYMIYVPQAAYVRTGGDFKADSDKSILTRLKEVPGIVDIKPSTSLTAGIVIVQMTSDVVDMVDGISPTVIQWESHGGMVQNFKVMTIMVPRMKSSYSDQCGIGYFTYA